MHLCKGFEIDSRSYGQEKASSGEYETVEQLGDDIALMVSNAKAFNEEGSEICCDAERIQVCGRSFILIKLYINIIRLALNWTKSKYHDLIFTEAL